MIAFGMIGIVTGLSLGARFRVLVLVPVQMAALALASTMLFLGAATFSEILFDLLAFSFSLQLAYLAAAIVPLRTRLYSPPQTRKA
jgi:hypothetical protein